MFTATFLIVLFILSIFQEQCFAHTVESSSSSSVEKVTNPEYKGYFVVLNTIASTMVPGLKALVGESTCMPNLRVVKNKDAKTLTLTEGKVLKLQTIHSSRSLITSSGETLEFVMRFAFDALPLTYKYVYARKILWWTLKARGSARLNVQGRTIVNIVGYVPKDIHEIIGDPNRANQCYLTVKSVTSQKSGPTLKSKVKSTNMFTYLFHLLRPSTWSVRSILEDTLGVLNQDVRDAVQEVVHKAIKKLNIVCPNELGAIEDRNCNRNREVEI